MSCVDGTLASKTLEYDKDKKALGVVVVSGGYPGSYKKGLPVLGKACLNVTTLTCITLSTSDM